MNRKTAKQQRKMRISRKIRGTQEKPRLSVFRSNHAIYAQIINDQSGKTLIGVSEKLIQEAKSNEKQGTKTEKAKKLGFTLAELAKKHKIAKVVFDKGAYRYHGRVKAFAEGAREGGLQF